MEKFIDRREAGALLAGRLKAYSDSDALVLALPRGGVPVAYEIAHALHLPLDVFLVRKLGVPGQQELAMGAIAVGNMTVLNQELIHKLHIDQAQIDEVIQKEQQELRRRVNLYRQHTAFPTLENQTIILVDDGMATGATMQVAITALRQHKPSRIIIAIPVAAKDTIAKMSNLADQIICPFIPAHFQAVGAFYDNFQQVSDEEVITLLSEWK